MTLFPKRPLNTETEKKIYKIFTHVIAQATSQDDITALFFDFLSHTEREMLPKRVCIAYLLIKKYDQRAISRYLKVSFTTITKVSTALKNGGKGYKTMLDHIQKQKEFSAMLIAMESGIGGFLSNHRKTADIKMFQQGAYAVAHTMAESTPDILPPHS